MNRLRILTLDIRNRKGPWDARLSLIREGIRAWNPDVIGPEEVLLENDHTQADEIREGLGYEAAFGTAHELDDNQHFGNAVLSRYRRPWWIVGACVQTNV